MERHIPMVESRHPECTVVERLLKMEVEGVRGKVDEVECEISDMRKTIEAQVEKIWTEIRVGQAQMTKSLADHAKENSDAMHIMQTQLLSRVPAWALTIMTVGGTIMGAMAMYILDRLK